MIGRLRKKFVLINMLLVSAVLLAVLAVATVSSYRQLEGESIAAMRQALGRGKGEAPPSLEIHPGRRPDRPFLAVPVFWVQTDRTGAVTAVFGQDVSISEQTLADITAQALAGKKNIGLLRGYDLRYLAERSPDGTARVAFADRTAEKDSLLRHLLTALLAGCGALGAFFVISLFLAHWALLPVQQAWVRQQQFVADASHELKTPLTVILASLGILLAHPDDTIEQQRRWVENIRAEAQSMKRLVEDLLFLAKSDAARTPARVAPFSLSDTVLGAALSFEPVAFERGVTLQSEIAPDLWMQGDEAQLGQLTAILLDNACKYSPAGGMVTVSLAREQSAARLRVHNTGIAISAQDLEHLFERFYRAEKSRAHKSGGYGLGLAIAQSIAQAHSGKIGAESREGQGTAFWVTLPLQK